MVREVSAPLLHRFREFELDEELGQLRCRGAIVHVQPKPFELLLYLVRSAGRVVPRDELRRALWPDTAVGDEALAFALHSVRRALGDDGSQQRVIRTVPRRGFLLAVPVESRPKAPAPRRAADAAAWASPPFIGREGVLDDLRALLEQASAGRGRIWLVSGEAGIGKTRTTEEALRIAGERGFRTLLGRCIESDGAPAFWPWLRLLRTLVDVLPRDAVVAALAAGAPQLARLVPELSGSLPESLREDAALDPKAERFLLFEAVGSLFRLAADEAPILLVLDDLHRADLPSLFLLRHLARALADSRFLVLGTFRDAELLGSAERARVMAEVAREEGARAHALLGLDAEAVGELVEVVSGHAPSSVVCRELVELTNGNPFFLNQVLQVLRSEERISDVEREEALALVFPHRVQDAISHQLDGLSVACRELLALAAVAGRDFDVATLAGASQRERAEVLALLDVAAEARVVVRNRKGFGSYRFAHVLMRDALYGRLDGEARRQAHERVASALEKQLGTAPGPHLPVVAHHFREAARQGEVRKAIDYSLRAGDWAVASVAYEEAVHEFAHALELSDALDPGDTERRCEILLALGDAQTKACDRVGARASLGAAAALAKEAGLPKRLALAALRFAPDFLALEVYVYDAELVGLLEDALRALGEDDSPERARLLARLAIALHWAPFDTLERRQALCAEATRMAARLENAAIRRYVRCACDMALYSLVDPERYLRDTSLEDLGAGDAPTALLEQLLRLTSLLLLGRVADFDREIEGFAELAERLRQPQSRWYADLARSTRAFLRGRFSEGERLAERYRATGQSVLDVNSEHSFLLQRCMLRIDRGDCESLGGELEAIVARFPRRGWHSVLAHWYAEMGRYEEARSQLDIFLANDLRFYPKRVEWLIVQTCLSYAANLIQAPHIARQTYQLLLPFEERLVVMGYLSFCWGTVSEVLGVAASTYEDWEAAQQHFEDALARSERIRAWPALARTQYHYAKMLLARGSGRQDTRRAGVLIRSGQRHAQKLGLERLALRLRAIEGAAGAAVPEPSGESNVARLP